MFGIILMDSFKGCLDASAACRAASLAFGPEDSVVQLPMSDGGEGFCQVVTEAMGGHLVRVPVHGPRGEAMEAAFGLSPDGHTAVVEVAAASGLTLVPPHLRDPLRSSSYGTGELVAAALDSGASTILVGMGGSATCDGGLGMLQALGYRFLDGRGQPFDGNPVLRAVAGIDSSHAHRGLRRAAVHGLYDVDAPLCGEAGAALCYSPQKGAGPRLAGELDKWLHSIGMLYSYYSGRDALRSPGAGAAGGIGSALAAVLRAEMHPGVDFVLEGLGVGPVVEDALASGQHVVVATGEGRTDVQTNAGKVPAGVLRFMLDRFPEAVRAGRLHTVLCSGAVADRDAALGMGFEAVAAATPEGADLREAMAPRTAAANIRRALAEVLAGLDLGGR